MEYNKVDPIQVASRIMVIRDWKFGEEEKKGKGHWRALAFIALTSNSKPLIKK